MEQELEDWQMAEVSRKSKGQNSCCNGNLLGFACVFDGTKTDRLHSYDHHVEKTHIPKH